MLVLMLILRSTSIIVVGLDEFAVYGVELFDQFIEILGVAQGFLIWSREQLLWPEGR
jgi:hypothetical protein